VDPGALCPGPSGIITQYNIRFETGSVVNTESVNITRCTAGRCSHTYVPPSNPPSSYDSVSVAAENVVGVGPARNLLIQPICKLKFAMFYFENTETTSIPVFVPSVLNICTPTANPINLDDAWKPGWVKLLAFSASD